MKEIRIHGRGGQGSLVLAQFMAVAALEDGLWGQAFPFLGGGGERRGKAIEAFCRLSDRPIRIRSKVDQPDYIIIQDPTIIAEEDVERGLKPGGLILVNTDRPVDRLGLKRAAQATTFAADDLARRILGRPIMNTALLGAFAAATGELSLEAVEKAIGGRFPGELGRKNIEAARESFALVKEAGR